VVLVGCLPEGLAPESEAGVVDEDVDPAEPGNRVLDEAAAARRIAHVELERDVGVDPVDAPRAAGDLGACFAQRTYRPRAEAARGAGDDRPLAVEPAHCVRIYPKAAVDNAPMRRACERRALSNPPCAPSNVARGVAGRPVTRCTARRGRDRALPAARGGRDRKPGRVRP